MSENLGERLRLVRDSVLKEARSVTAEKLGVSLVSIQNYENGTREPSATFVVNFAKMAGVSLEWLLLGEGQMLKQAASEVALGSGSDSGHCVCLDTLGNPVDLDEFVFIPRYNLKAAAGHGATTEGEKPMFSMAFRRYWIENYLRATPTDLSVISVKGDSMEGVLNDRDVILLNTSDTQASSGLYVLRVDGDLVVKRVQRLPGGILRVISANEAYATFDVDLNNPPADFGVIGRVVWFGRQI
jgi:phage repressor protein C with HTH and peptisase S24 domain